MQSIYFLQQFLRNPIQTGAVTAAGSELCQLLAWAAFLEEANVILELGTGTGVVTEEIARKKPSATRLIGIEVNREFALMTHQRCPQVEIVNCCATGLKTVLLERSLDYCDCIVSGLPWASFSEELQSKLLNSAFAALRPGGRFVTYSYLHCLFLPTAQRFYTRLNDLFASVRKTSVVWKNIPPAFVYLASKHQAETTSEKMNSHCNQDCAAKNLSFL